MASPKNGPPKPEVLGGPLAERERRILELNKAGNSTREISRITKTPRTSVQRILDRLSHDPNNGVKDNSRNVIEEGKWFKIISHIRDSVLPFYQKELDIRPSLREVLYYLEEEGIVSKTEYGTLKKYTVRARKFSIYCPPGYENYPKLPIDCFEDDTRFVLGYHNELSPEDWTGFVKRHLDYIDNAITKYDGKGIPGVNPGRWFRSGHYVEPWIEKLALGKVFMKFLEGWDVFLVINRGYTSLTFMYNNCERLKEFAATHPGVKIHVRYFGDRDPSGSDMDRYMKDTLKLFGLRVDAVENHPEDVVDFKRVAITEEQIGKYHLPTAPKDEDAEERFDNDSRSEKYAQENGRAVTELESMLASKEKIDAFRKIVIDSMAEFWDEKEYLKYCPAGKMKEYSENELKEIRDKMYHWVNDSFVIPWKRTMIDNMMINALLSMLGLRSAWVIWSIIRLSQR